MTYFSDHLSGKELSIRFTARAFRILLSICVFSYFPFGFEGRIWDLIVSVPDHCLSFYLHASEKYFYRCYEFCYFERDFFQQISSESLNSCCRNYFDQGN